MTRTNPMYKDTVFRMLFKEPKEALSLYNALNGTSYDDPSALEIVTLENAIYLNMKNDVAIMIDSTLNLYEHQSTPNPNMPLRDLYYVSGELQRLFPAKNLYGRVKKAIPVPRFVVFYNGEESQAEKFSYKLSDLYAKQVADPELELIVTVYNINEGMNEDLKNACRSLKEYMQFVALVGQYRKTMPLQDAIEKAVKDCMAQDILKDFLESNRNQVVSTSLEEFDQELYEKIIRDEGREEARLTSIRNLMESMKIPAQQAMDLLKIPEAEQETYLSKL